LVVVGVCWQLARVAAKLSSAKRIIIMTAK
jgi:hypothetical protein